VHKVTVIPRGRALGATQILPEEDRLNIGESDLRDRLVFLLGGRAAEKLIFDEFSAGAEDDLNKATGLARRMVTHWGMSDKLGPIAYGENQQEVFLGHSVTQTKNVSEETARVIDSEVRKLVDSGYDKARTLITDSLNRLHDLANALLEHETLTGDEISAILRGKPMPKAPPPEPPSASAPTGGKRGSVPTTAPDEDTDLGGMEPSPQPGT